MARCPDCNKFVSFEEAEPEVNEISVDDDGQVSIDVRIVNTCGECGTELTEATLTLEGAAEVAGHDSEATAKGEEHELDAEESGSERTSRQGYFKAGKFIPQGGRYGKTFYGASVTVTITCSCGKLGEDGKGVDLTLEDEVQASEMESLT